MNRDRTELTDRELDRLLASVASPPAPLGAETRLMKRIAALETEAAPIGPAPKTRYWLAGLPLAASLAIGLYVGATGAGTTYLTGVDAETASLEDDWGTGLEEVELVAEEDLS